MAIDAHRVEPYGAQPVASKYDYIDKDSKLRMSENQKVVMVNSKADLEEITPLYKPGAIAYTPAFKNLWQLNSLGEWVSIIGDDSGDDVDADTQRYIEYFVKTVTKEITEINDDQGLITGVGNNIFANCPNLTTVSFPEATSIGSSAFGGCSSLTTVSFPKATSISNAAFVNCPNLTTVSFPEATSISNGVFSVCSSLTTVSFPKATSIGGSAFGGCNNMTDLYLPNAESTYTNRDKWFSNGMNVTVHYNTSFDADGNPII